MPGSPAHLLRADHSLQQERDPPIEHTPIEGHVGRDRLGQPVDHVGRHVWVRRSAAPPAPAAVRPLEIGQPFQAGPDHVVHHRVVEHRVVAASRGLQSARTEVRGSPLSFDLPPHRCQVDAQLLQRAPRDHGRQEPAHGLLGAAVGVAQQKRQGVDHHRGDRRVQVNLHQRRIGGHLPRHGQ